MLPITVTNHARVAEEEGDPSSSLQASGQFPVPDQSLHLQRQLLRESQRNTGSIADKSLHASELELAATLSTSHSPADFPFFVAPLVISDGDEILSTSVKNVEGGGFFTNRADLAEPECDSRRAAHASLITCWGLDSGGPDYHLYYRHQVLPLLKHLHYGEGDAVLHFDHQLSLGERYVMSRDIYLGEEFRHPTIDSFVDGVLLERMRGSQGMQDLTFLTHSMGASFIGAVERRFAERLEEQVRHPDDRPRYFENVKLLALGWPPVLTAEQERSRSSFAAMHIVGVTDLLAPTYPWVQRLRQQCLESDTIEIFYDPLSPHRSVLVVPPSLQVTQVQDARRPNFLSHGADAYVEALLKDKDIANLIRGFHVMSSHEYAEKVREIGKPIVTDEEEFVSVDDVAVATAALEAYRREATAWKLTGRHDMHPALFRWREKVSPFLRVTQ